MTGNQKVNDSVYNSDSIKKKIEQKMIRICTDKFLLTPQELLTEDLKNGWKIVNYSNSSTSSKTISFFNMLFLLEREV